MTRAEPPNSNASLTGLRATRRRLARDDRTEGSSLLTANRRPWRVIMTRPATAATTARITSSVLLDGSLNARPRPRPAQLKKTTSRIAWTMTPASALTPTAVDARGRLDAGISAGSGRSAPCRRRCRSETRLTNEEAPWVSTVGQNGSRTATLPSSEMALAR